MKNARALQLGGKGIHVVKFLLAGASKAWLLTPMVDEAKFAQALAEVCGVGKQLTCLVGIAEELPFPDCAFERVYSGSCMHHMVTEIATAEVARILTSGGRFAAVDPWRAPFYGIGTKVLGKREPDVHCRPLTSQRVAPVRQNFSRSQVIHHGTLTRYLLLALEKFGIESSLAVVSVITRIDDTLCTLLRLRHYGSSVAVLASK
jgi:SAM-dependent methyltransferase